MPETKPDHPAILEAQRIFEETKNRSLLRKGHERFSGFLRELSNEKKTLALHVGLLITGAALGYLYGNIFGFTVSHIRMDNIDQQFAQKFKDVNVAVSTLGGFLVADYLSRQIVPRLLRG